MRSPRLWVLMLAGNLALFCGGMTFSQSLWMEEKLHGRWNCEVSSEQDGVKMSMDYAVTYSGDGTADASGRLRLKTAQLPEMEYSITSRSEWEISDGHLVETSDDIDVVNVSHPHFDRVFDLQSMIPENATETSEILVLGDSRLKTRSEKYGTITDCARRS